MSNPNDYVVGWICAISTELVAARAFLDEEHDPPDAVPPHDNNIYKLGKIGQHNVVIAALPDGEYGIAAAASVARDMLHSFPNVRIGLMVGIGGGVPGRHDIRLGDVVVSATRNEQAGIFQYDFGKTIQAQEFQNTMFLNQPPALLRSAVGGLKADYESNGHQFQETINSILTRKPRLRKKYQRPDANTDRLYLSNAVHPLTSNESCSKACSDSMLAPRERRAEDEDDPIIHYGLIASGNQLIKDALTRDQLASEKDVLCFEMEAAGLMNHFPCLVIRGICDYSDSHKNDIWQGYAAMTAAAYAKDLIRRISPTKIEAENRIADALSGVKQGVDRLVSVYHDQRNVDVLDWLAPLDYSTQQSDHLRRRQEGTGEWLLNSDEFQAWIQNKDNILFCPGIPGAGKTVLTSVVVDHLHSRFREDSKTGIAYFFFDYKQQDEQTIDALLANFLRQLTACQSPLPEAVHELYKQHNTQSNRTRPSTEELIRVLKSVAVIYSKIFIMIDALDECKSSNDTRLRVLSCISRLRSEISANFLITSRFNTEIESAFSDNPTLEIRASDKDVKSYLSGNMVHLPKFVRDDPSLQKEIIESILQAVQGMFLVAQFHLDSLKGKTKPKEIKIALQNLATGSDAYEQIYINTMERILGQYKEQTQLAKSVLSWLTFAKGPMRVPELRHALGVEHRETTFDERNMPDIELMVSVCAGLVTIDNDSNIIRLVHYTTQEYFQRAHEKWFPESQSEITMSCITYLSYEVFELRADKTLDDIIKCIDSYPFYDYASLYWGDHAREDSLLNKGVMEFLKDQARVKSYYQLLNHIQEKKHMYSSSRLGEQNTGLHLATWFGLTAVVDLLLNNSRHIEATNKSNHTILHIAAVRGHENIVQLLLNSNANTEAVDHNDNTPLHYAAEKGYKAVVQLLLNSNANIEAVDTSGRTPLHYAAEKGYKAVIQLLLNSNANIEAVDKSGRTSLHYAAEQGHKAVVQLLLNSNANIEAVDKDGWTSLHFAARSTKGPVAQLLLDKGANIEAADKDGVTPLHSAAEAGNVEISALLLSKGAKVNATDSNSDTPLHKVFLSKAYGYVDSVVPLIQLLLNNGADIEATDREGATPLNVAALFYDTEGAASLLMAGAEVNAADNNGKTPLWNALSETWCSGDDIIATCVELLLDYGADIQAIDKNGNTLLHQAVKNDDRPLAELVLNQGAKVNAVNSNSRTPLFNLIKSPPSTRLNEDAEFLTELLLKHGADVQATDDRGCTVLDMAFERNDIFAVKLLRCKGAIRASDGKIENLENRARKRVRLNSLGEIGEVAERTSTLADFDFDAFFDTDANSDDFDLWNPLWVPK